MDIPGITLASLALCLGMSFPCMSAQRATKTPIKGPHQLALDERGNLYVSEEYGKRVLRIGATDRRVTVVAGNGKECCRKENVPAQQSSVYHVYSLAVDSKDNLYIGGRNARDNAFVRVVRSDTGRISTVAQESAASDPAIGVSTLHANLSDPAGIVVLPDGRVLVSADGANVIVALNETTTVFAGTPSRKTFSGEGGLATEAGFDLPGALAVDSAGNVFVAGYFNHRVRRIDAKTHIVNTVAGNGSENSSGDGGAATAAGVRYPYAIAVDTAGNLFIVENGEFKVRRVDEATGVITTVAGTGVDGFSGDAGPAVRAEINPSGIAVDATGNLYIADLEHNRIRRVDASGIVVTIAGNGLPHRKEVIE
jgi:NHL repeat-containing protein